MKKIVTNWKIIVNVYNRNIKEGSYSTIYDYKPKDKEIFETYEKSLNVYPFGSREIIIQEFYKVEGYGIQQS